jgi:hypothetical protein
MCPIPGQSSLCSGLSRSSDHCLRLLRARRGRGTEIKDYQAWKTGKAEKTEPQCCLMSSETLGNLRQKFILKDSP